MKLRSLFVCLAALLLVAVARPAPGARAPRGRVSLTADYNSLRDSTRVVLSLSDYVPYSISQPPGQLVIRFQSDRIAAAFENILVEDGALQRIVFRTHRGRGAVVLHLGRDFLSYQPIVLKEPFRIVVDITRRSAWDGPKKRPVMAEPEPVAEPSAAPEPELGQYTGERVAADGSATDLERSVEQRLRGLDGLPGDPAGGLGGDTPRDSRIRTVVLDPGHGGSEVGAQGANGVFEKDICLAIALQLKGLLQRELGVRVVLTRSTDVLLGLHERTAIANNHKADLFISIHANASRRPDARGAETYFLSKDATDDASRLLAVQENQALGVDDAAIYGTDLELILWDLAQVQYLEESQALGEAIQAELNALLGIRQRGVKQAPFAVLMGATMPAVLVEAAFISNPQEARLLASEAFREKVAEAIYRSVRSFVLDRQQRMGPLELSR